MYLEFDKDYFNNFVTKALGNQSRFVKSASNDWGNSTRSSYFNLLTDEEFEKLEDLANQKEEKNGYNRSLQMQISKLKKILDTESALVRSSNLRDFSTALFCYLTDEMIDGWMYRRIGKSDDYTPVLITRIRYVPSMKDDPAFVEMKYVYNGNSERVIQSSVTFHGSDISKRNVFEVLQASNFYHESPEFKEKYNADKKRFDEAYKQKFKQFLSTGSALASYYSSSINLPNYVKIKKPVKVINEERSYIRSFDEIYENRFWEETDIHECFFNVPTQFFIKVFDLEKHDTNYVFVNDLELYKYDTKMSEKIVLPEHQKELIDVLVNDFDVLKSDIVEGKSGGTSILCVGKPGLGKTLSAEIYSESSQRPLYKIHSGQLGLDSDSVEKQLRICFERSERWNAVVLIDEADIFIRERGNDIAHNAVVASFLRTLEYFNGLLFMTSNRENDIDDAIISRCIAMIRYVQPDYESRVRIWTVLAESFKEDLNKELIEELAKHFPDTSGRDIKELLKLTSRYVKAKGLEHSLENFRICSQFKMVSYTE